MDVSIIIRFKNEEQYLPYVLNALSKQDFIYGTFEIVGVDNNSTDQSLEICKKFTKKIITIDDYIPGKALNTAIERCGGKNIAVLSAHTIPSNDQWLNLLFQHHNYSKLAGVYGAQLYPINSKFLDKRDLDIFSTTKPRIETKDSDFWNANSLFPKTMWEIQPFDETVFELEDHYWTKQLLPLGYVVHFEPGALVYHYSHIKRLDREYLGEPEESVIECIKQAAMQLSENKNSWPNVMKAGLTLSSLTSYQELQDFVTLIGETLITHYDFDVRWRMAQALGKIPTDLSAEYLVKALFDESFYPRDEAAWSLARLGKISTPIILAHLSEFPFEVLPFAALALGKSGNYDAEKIAVDILLNELNSGDINRQKNAAYFAGEINKASSASRLISPLNELLTLNTDSSHVFCWALGSLGIVEPRLVSWKKIFEFSYSHPDVLTRFESIVAIGKYAKSTYKQKAIKRLVAGLNDGFDRTRYGAIQSLRLLAESGYKLNLCDEIFSKVDKDNGVEYEKSLLLRV